MKASEGGKIAKKELKILLNDDFSVGERKLESKLLWIFEGI